MFVVRPEEESGGLVGVCTVTLTVRCSRTHVVVYETGLADCTVNFVHGCFLKYLAHGLLYGMCTKRLCCLLRYFWEESGPVCLGVHHPLPGSAHVLHLSLQHHHEGKLHTHTRLIFIS